MCSSFAKKKGAPLPRSKWGRQAFPWRLARTGNRREGILRSTRPAARLTGEWKTKKNATGRPSTSFRWGRVAGSPCSANGTRAGRPRGRLRGCPDQKCTTTLSRHSAKGRHGRDLSSRFRRNFVEKRERENLCFAFIPFPKNHLSAIDDA